MDRKPPNSGPKLLSSGNPQIAKGYGDAPVSAYIAAMPGWKSEIGRRLDEIIVTAVPNVHKAVKWNSPLYGSDGKSWFMNFYCFKKYIKVGFFNGKAMNPLPPVASTRNDVRYLHIFEEEQLDERQLADWAIQASRLPGEKM